MKPTTTNQRMRDLFDKNHDRPARFTGGGQRKAEQHRKQQHLKDLAFGKGIDHGVGNDVQQKIDGALRMRGGRVTGERLGIQRGDVDVHPRTRLERIDHDDADDQRDRAHGLEIEQRLATDAADLLHVLHAGDTGHHGAENDRRDNHLDELDEAVAQRLHCRADIGPEVAEQHSTCDREQDSHIKMLVDRLFLHRIPPRTTLAGNAYPKRF